MCAERSRPSESRRRTENSVSTCARYPPNSGGGAWFALVARVTRSRTAAEE